ncbi:MAG: substrate-binding domain-containing protein [Geminicoccaceae bacterium]|nr:substrate-binding domain-containing protein [Geminicoccaceae bacterium]
MHHLTRRMLMTSTVVLGLSLAAPLQAQEKTILTSVPSLGFPFFVHMMKALQEEAAAQGVATIESDGQNSAPKQTADVEAAVVQGVDGIVISPSDVNAMAPAIQTAVENGVPVVTIDRRVDGVPGILAHVGADNVIGGEAQGHLIMELFPDGAKIVNLQGQPGASPAIDRNKGLHNVLDQDDKYEIVVEQTANFARDQGLAVTESILAGMDTPPDVIVAANDDMALGAAEAVRARGIDEVVIIGFDALPEALAAVRDGGLTATIEQFPGEQSRTAMRLMVDHVKNGAKPMEEVVLLQPIAITKDNLDKAERLGELN